MFSSLTNIDLEEMAKHLGVTCCITLSFCEVFASSPEYKTMLLKMGDEFANWRGSRHQYEFFALQWAARPTASSCSYRRYTCPILKTCLPIFLQSCFVATPPNLIRDTMIKQGSGFYVYIHQNLQGRDGRGVAMLQSVFHLPEVTTPAK